jgi:hypothetical protein
LPFAVWLPFGPDVLSDAALRQAKEARTSVFAFWQETAIPGVSKTEVTVAGPAMSWTGQETEAAVRDFASYLPGGEGLSSVSS